MLNRFQDNSASFAPVGVITDRLLFGNWVVGENTNNGVRATDNQWKDWDHYLYYFDDVDDPEEDLNNWKYTALFIDLMDNNNQRITEGSGAGDVTFPNDDVDGYTIRQLQKAVENSRTLRQVRDYLRDNYTNPTEGGLNDLFTFYINVESYGKAQ